MSKLAFKGADTGTGTVQVESPITNTNRVITLPDSDGEILVKDSFMKNVYTNGGYNYIIDGAFDFFYESNSQTTAGYGSDTMWLNFNVGSTKTHSIIGFGGLGKFTEGDVYPYYLSRTVVTSVAGAGNYCIKQQSIEDVTRLAGKKVTLSFYASADAPKNIAIDLTQNFGTGGSPSAAISAIAAQKIALTAGFKKYSVTIDIPSIAGKTLGTNLDSRTNLTFWFDAGSTYDSRSSSLGQQSGTFDLALVKLEEGEVATPYVRDVVYEQDRVNRYYEISVLYTWGLRNSYTSLTVIPWSYKVRKRIVPTTLLQTMILNTPATTYNSTQASSTWGCVFCYNVTATEGGIQITTIADARF